MITINGKYALFLREWPSNFYRAPIKMICPDNEVRTFFCNEQAFMWWKAYTFGDMKTAEAIMKATTPMEAKDLGRKVSPFDSKKWYDMSYDIFYKINYAKYTQNEDCRAKLMDRKFDGKEFVEANPRDIIWSCGLDQNNPMAGNKDNWLGENRLGDIITKVRAQIKAEKGNA